MITVRIPTKKGLLGWWNSALYISRVWIKGLETRRMNITKWFRPRTLLNLLIGLLGSCNARIVSPLRFTAYQQTVHSKYTHKHNRYSLYAKSRLVIVMSKQETIVNSKSFRWSGWWPGLINAKLLSQALSTAVALPNDIRRIHLHCENSRMRDSSQDGSLVHPNPKPAVRQPQSLCIRYADPSTPEVKPA